MKFTLLTLIFLFGIKASFTQGWMPQGARSSALGNASTVLTDVFAYHHNPGALGFNTTGGVGASYENRYLMRELQSQGVTLVQPLKKGVISAGGQFYGYETFRTNRVGAGYSMKLTDKLSAGVQLNYLNVRLDEFYGVKHTVTGEFGMLAKLSDKLSLGFSVFNLGRTKLSEFQDDRLTTLMRLGAGYRFSKRLVFLLELENEITKNPRLKGGVEYAPSEFFYVRAGFQGAPVELSFGFGAKWGQFILDLATHYHQQLGWTPSAAMIFQFKKESDD
ncbi:MAG: hypothetical protein WEA99_12065 [Brumimicrobium sp.]